MNSYMLFLGTIENMKKFVNRILNINSYAEIETDNGHRIDAKSIMGIVSLDLSKDLLLEINGEEPEFIQDISNMGIYIEPFIKIGENKND